MNTIVNKLDDSLGKKPVAQGSTQPLRSPEMMKAITYGGKRNMKVDFVQRPMITHPEDVLIKTTAVTICSGSDGHIYAGEIPGVESGFVIGHEAMGVIIETGADVKNLKVGDRCVICFDIACGKCEHCQKEQYTGCETTNSSKLADKFYGHAPAGLFGYGKLLGEHMGSQAEFVRVPFGDVNCFKIPDDVPDEKALYLSDVLCTSLCAVDMGKVSSDDTVAIWGLGPIGLCTARWCQIKGAKRIVGIDSVPERLSLAMNSLGIEVIDRSDMKSQQLCDELLQLEPKGFSVCVEAVGFRFPVTTKHKVARALNLETDTADIIDECLTCLKPYGIVSIVGDYAGYANMFPVGKIMFAAATVSSRQANCQKYVPYALEKIRDGTFDPTFMISHRIAFDDIPLAYEKLHKKEDGFIKVFVDMK